MKKSTSIGEWVSAIGLTITIAGGLVGFGRMLGKLETIEKQQQQLNDRIVDVETEAFMGLLDTNTDQAKLKEIIQKMQKERRK